MLLHRGGVIDITTLGARTGTERRIEINFHDWAGVTTSRVGLAERDWLANMRANPKFTVHVKHGLTADVAAEAEEITNELTESWGNDPAKAEYIIPRRMK